MSHTSIHFPAGQSPRFLGSMTLEKMKSGGPGETFTMLAAVQTPEKRDASFPKRAPQKVCSSNAQRERVGQLKIAAGCLRGGQRGFVRLRAVNARV